MEIREANYKIEKLNNELRRLLRDKESLETRIGVGAIDTSRIVVDGGKRIDRLVEYTSFLEENDIDDLRNLETKIHIVEDKIENLMNWVDEELKILKKNEKALQLIIYYKEVCPKNYTWDVICMQDGVYYSVPQAKRKYYQYKRKQEKRRYIKDDTK